MINQLRWKWQERISVNLEDVNLQNVIKWYVYIERASEKIIKEKVEEYIYSLLNWIGTLLS